jgi:uridine kinase
MIIIGIGGISCSGKTTFAKKLNSILSDSEIINFDNYYRHRPELSFESRQNVNYDNPDSIEIIKMINDIRTLMNGKTVKIPIYDFTLHLKSSKKKIVKPTNYLIIEGIFTTVIPEIRELMDLIIFIDTDVEIAAIRRIRRDIMERGREALQICDQMEATVFRGNKELILPSRIHADFIVSGIKPFENVLRNVIKMVK